MASPESAAQAGLFPGLGMAAGGRAEPQQGEREDHRERKSKSSREGKEDNNEEWWIFGFVGVSRFPTDRLCRGGTTVHAAAETYMVAIGPGYSF